MLVTCKQCGVSFADSLGQCISCGAAFVPSASESEEVARSAAVRMLESEASKKDVRRRLVDELRLGEMQAEQVLSDAVRVVRERAKSQGRAIASSGFLLLLIALGVLFLTGGRLLTIGCFAFGGVMVLVGGIKASTGWNLTGHDDG